MNGKYKCINCGARIRACDWEFFDKYCIKCYSAYSAGRRDAMDVKDKIDYNIRIKELESLVRHDDHYLKTFGRLLEDLTKRVAELEKMHKGVKE